VLVELAEDGPQHVFADVGETRAHQVDIGVSGDCGDVALYFAKPLNLADARSDVYAFSVSFYESLAGRRPVSAPTRIAAVPFWLNRLLQRGLHPDTDKRIASARMFAAQLRRGLESSHRLKTITLTIVSLLLVLVAAQRSITRYECAPGQELIQKDWSEAMQHALRRGAGDLPVLALSRWVRGFASRYEAVCSTPVVLIEQQRSTLECMNDAWTTFAIKTRLLSAKQNAGPEQVLATVDALPALDACLDPRGRVAPSSTRTITEREALYSAIALADSGSYREARERLVDALDAPGMKDPSPLRAQGLASLAFVQRYAEPDAVEQTCFEARLVAETLHDDALRAEIIIACVQALSFQTGLTEKEKSSRELAALMTKRHWPLEIQAGYQLSLGASLSDRRESFSHFLEASALLSRSPTQRPKQMISAIVNACQFAPIETSEERDVAKQVCAQALQTIKSFIDGEVDAMAGPETALAEIALKEGDVSTALRLSHGALTRLKRSLPDDNPHLHYVRDLTERVAASFVGKKEQSEKR
jgi:hypothetical protein